MTAMNERTIVIGAAAILSIGCAGATTKADPRLCEQTYEFGNTGCFEISGRVLDRNQRPIERAIISAGPVADSTGEHRGFASAVGYTDHNGQFQVRAHRMFSMPGDTANTFRVKVLVARPDPVLVKDSAFTAVTVAPVGSPANTVVVNFTLAVP